MRREGQGLKVFLNFIISLEDKGVNQVSVLRPLEDDVGKVCQESIKTSLHISDHLDFPRQLIPKELLDRLIVRNLRL